MSEVAREERQRRRAIWLACQELLAESGGARITSYEVAERTGLDHAVVAEDLRDMDEWLFTRPFDATEGQEAHVEVLGLDEEYPA